MSDPMPRTVDDLKADLAASAADIEAGRVVPGEAVLARIQAALDRYEAQQRRGDRPAAMITGDSPLGPVTKQTNRKESRGLQERNKRITI